jgi:hypothetical protein
VTTAGNIRFGRKVVPLPTRAAIAVPNTPVVPLGPEALIDHKRRS